MPCLQAGNAHRCTLAPRFPWAPASARAGAVSSERPIDIAIAGGGLAGGLIALALRARRPELRVVVIESGANAGGNHIWSCFEHDVALADRWLIEPLIVHGWGEHAVRFPSFERNLPGGYASLSSERLDAALRDALPPGDLLLGARVTGLMPTCVTLADGRTLEAGGVVDCRGPGDLGALDLGWQKFVGMSMKTDAPHGLTHPVIMDATVDQSEGYRFVYVLPLSASELFIEDTYYTAGPELAVDALKARIADYAAAQGWTSTPGDRIETGVLPVCMGGDFERYWRASSRGVAKAGLRGGFFHAMTGYSLPDAVRVALHLAAMPHLSGAALHERTLAMARAHWRGQAYYRLLATMLFRAAEPAERWRILARFYRLDPKLIGRFYAGRSSLIDKLRVLIGRPPVPIGRAIQALGRASGAPIT
ncbi:MAG: lycopene beta-cyclase CrtY [Sphingobium sp.]|nr:lycopene beta-cyclase CrtY [Sphingobium sp.]